ncbi:MAG: helix-turn-helix transcriptional regulator [Armatimonadia bacterium]
MARRGLSWGAVATGIGKSRGTVSNTLAGRHANPETISSLCLFLGVATKEVWR